MRGSLTRSERWFLFGVLIVGGATGALWRREPHAPPPKAPIKSGTELVLVFLGSSTCQGIQNPDLPAAIERAKRALIREAAQRKLVFASIGVSLDWGLEQGVDLLRRFGSFDEIVVGRGWLNTAALKYLWQDLPGEATIPQLVVMERQIKIDGSLEVSGEHVRVRRIGAYPIIAWTKALQLDSTSLK